MEVSRHEPYQRRERNATKKMEAKDINATADSPDDYMFQRWFNVADLPLPVEPVARNIAIDNIRRAYRVGWQHGSTAGAVAVHQTSSK
jgi:hypothetical protein